MSKIPAYLLVLIALLMSSCGNSRSRSQAGIISEKKMVELLVDTHLADAILFVDNSRSEEKRDKALFYYPSVLGKHGITKAQMDSSVAWYTRNPAAYGRIYDQVIKELEKRMTAEKKAQITE